jgi:hypothetical protein
MTLYTPWFVGRRAITWGAGTEPGYYRYWYNDRGIIAVEWA